ncbi:MAG: sporulation integral membrane protein YtvI [Clostridia bacterium]|nr:sporulation integral membrane protein YtvI [Clostridia bacterium]
MYGGIIRKLFWAALIAVIIWGALRFLLPLALPFILAWMVAFCLQPAVRLLSGRFGVSRRPVAAVFVSVTVLGIGTVAFLLVSRLFSETGRFIAQLGSETNGGIQSFFDSLNGMILKVPFLSTFFGDVSVMVEAALTELISGITAALPSFIAEILSALPSFFLFTVILIMASYYFAADYDEISEKMLSVLPYKLRSAWESFKERLMSAGIQYLKACVILAFITFAELLVGFFTLGVPYAFTLALIIALVDMLPILGAGTALVPWAIWEWVTGDTYYAIGLFIIFAVVSVVRRFAEPRIISSGIGLSPITTLISMYVGYRFFGLGGLFLAPLFAVLILNAFPQSLAQRLGMRFENYGKKKERFGIKNE